MRNHIATLILFVTAIAISPGQNTPTAADQAFLDLQIAARPLPIPPPAAGSKKTREEFERDRKMQSAAFIAAATRAKEFYTRYPQHEKSAEAKKIEVVSLLRATQTGSVENEPKAMRLAREFRSDNKMASRDRYHVATMVTQIELGKKKITDRTELMAEYERRTLDLYGEFPDEPAVFDLFLGIARNADSEKARSVANQILRMPAPAGVKEEAQAVIDRLDMPGKAIALEWQDENGKSHSIADYKGKVVVFYLWASWTPASDVAHPKVASGLKSGVELVSVNVDTEPGKGKSMRGKVPPAAVSYYDERGLRGPLPKQLKAMKVPAVHVVDASGVYIGSGSADELGSLLQRAGK